MSVALLHRRDLALVAAGGALGTLARYGLVEAFPVGPRAFPTITLAINVAGAWALGFLLGHLARRGRVDAGIRLFAGVGVLGSFTTFSAFTVEVAGLLRDGAAPLALGYVAATVVGGVGACVAGLSVAGSSRGAIPDGGES